MQKKRIWRIVSALLVCVVLSGCQPVEPVATDTETPIITMPVPSPPTSETPAETTTQPATTQPADMEGIYKSAEEKVMPHIEAALAKLEEGARDDLSKQNFPPEEREMAYEELTERQKQLYDEMQPKIKALEYFEYTAEEHGYEVMDDAFIAWGAIAEDNLEINNYFMLYERLEGDMTTAIYSLYFHPYSDQTEPAEDLAKLRNELDEFEFACNIIVEHMPQQASAYDKYRYLAYVISYATDYDHSLMGGMQLGNSYGGILGGKSICQGYAQAMQYLCDRAGLWCRMVEGSSRDEAHAWNMVLLEDGSYHVDITWADESAEPGAEGWMRYYMLTQQQVLTDHDISFGDEANGTVNYAGL